MPAFARCPDLSRPCDVHFSKPGGDLVVTTLFTTVADPQRKVYHACDPRNTTWYASLRPLGVSALVLHDCVSPQDVVALQTQQVRFFRVDPPRLFSTNDYRFMLYYGILSGQPLSASMFDRLQVNARWSPPVARVFLTDMLDVTFTGNPFDLVFGDRYHLYVGSEAGGPNITRPPDIPGRWNAWMFRKAVACGLAAGREDVEGRLMASTLFNSGIVGGPVGHVLSLLRAMTLHMLSSPAPVQGANCNMVVFNKCLNDLFSADAVFTGFPLHSGFKRYEEASSGAFIIHK